MTRADLIADEFEGSDPAQAGAANGRHNGHIPRLHSRTAHPDGTVVEPEVAPAERDIEAPASSTPDSTGTAPAHDPRPATEPAVLSDSGPEAEPTPDPPRHRDQRDQVAHVEHAHESLPEMARAAAGTWLRAAGWTAGTSLRVGSQLAKIAADPNTAQEVIDDVAREVRGVAREFLGVNDLDAQIQQIAPLVGSGLLRRGGSSPEALRAQGEELLRQAADVGFNERTHPAFARILTELAPDEARILRTLSLEGPQPMVDVRASNLIGNGSQLIAQALNMLGVQSGVRYRDRVPVYLANLVRLNLIALSDEQLGNPAAYQVLEAQPEVLGTIKDTPRAKSIRRSIVMTPLGQEFCDVCLPPQQPALPAPSHER